MKKSFGSKTLVMPAPAWVIGTYDTEGKPNIMTAAWGGVCCSDPACLYVSLRKQRHTFQAALDNKAFTVNVPSAKYVEQADYCGMYSGKDHDKFKETGLTPVKSEFVNAPYVDEFPMIVECALIQTVDLGAHTMFIGEIKDVKADESVLGADGKISMELADPLVYNIGDRTYYSSAKPLAKAFGVGKKLRS